jgi:hypothetical protein
MYLLYLDESGNPDDAADTHFALAGAAVHEDRTFYVARDLDAIQNKHFPGAPPIEFHASEIRSGKGFWRKVVPETRAAVLDDIVSVVAGQDHKLVLFGAVVEKQQDLHGEDAVRAALEEVCRRFDLFLVHRFKQANDRQRGLIVFAEGSYHKRSRTWVKSFRKLGTKWGHINNLSDIPYFASAAETRLLQVADVISHAAFLLYERRDPSLAKRMLHKFDGKGDGILHGLVHITTTPGYTCDCPKHVSRRQRHSLGPWCP